MTVTAQSTIEERIEEKMAVLRSRTYRTTEPTIGGVTVPCPDCDGKGEIEVDVPVHLEPCASSEMVECEECNGRGYPYLVTCEVCGDDIEQDVDPIAQVDVFEPREGYSEPVKISTYYSCAKCHEDEFHEVTR